jgi:DNA-binding NarL/FixJ family response regulator
MPVLRQKPRKVLLVGSDASSDVEKQLVHADCDVVKTNTGVAAVAHARHKSFSTAVLMSASGEMDLAETALTLTDIQPSLEIIILMDRTPNREMTDQVAAVVRAIPKSRILTKSDLNTYLTSSESR